MAKFSPKWKPLTLEVVPRWNRIQIYHLKQKKKRIAIDFECTIGKKLLAPHVSRMCFLLNKRETETPKKRRKEKKRTFLASN